MTLINRYRTKVTAMLVLAATLTAMLAASAASAHKSSLGQATARIMDANGATVGEAKLVQKGDGIRVRVRVEDLEPGKHGIHIHSVGACDPATFASAGPHFNPESRRHGLLNPAGAHAGDLPNLVVRESGVGVLRTTTERASLLPGPKSLFDADGSALVIHAAEDDQTTDPTGNSGSRVACGVIEKKP